MSRVPRVAVIGTGSLGKEHARLYAELPAAGEAAFAGVLDTNPEHAARAPARHGVPVLPSLEAALAAAEAFSVVTPTVTHFDLASRLLAAGRHVLVEKPMCDTAADAAPLVELARAGGLVLQVGHV
ncbi:MAG TPA: Gfo/Idh/MocA family oxidoreductase, partial [Verrucomicrobiota bacterium]|nr:Gfo/Idh/MocA family oxidoreductase [Verrucomicrobiota bacterium]